MKHFLSLSLIFLALLSGCGGSRVTDWAAEHFEQGHVRAVPKEQALKYLRTARIYKDFSTVGIFNVLWLSHDVRQAYIDVHSSKYALDKEQTDTLLRKQRLENDNFISFYVLSFMPDSNASLGDKNSPWSIELRIDKKVYAPKVFEAAELSPEYTMFLSKYLDKHKQISLVKFAARDDAGNDLITPNTRMIEVRLSTVERYTTLTWYIDKDQKLLKYKGSK